MMTRPLNRKLPMLLILLLVAMNESHGFLASNVVVTGPKQKRQRGVHHHRPLSLCYSRTTISRSLATNGNSSSSRNNNTNNSNVQDSTITTEESSSSSSSSVKQPTEFDETAYEKERLSRDAQAMDAMKEEADLEFAKGLRTPWKWKLRKRIWDYMEDNDIARFPRPVHHRIPNFVGADLAAERLATLPEFQSAKIVKVNPDTPQRPVRHKVLEQGKTLLTPQPRLRTGFFSTIRMSDLPSLVKVEECTNSKGVVKWGTPITLNEEYTVDLVVVGSTAVCPRTGARVGKGEGFAELEWGILTAQGNLDAERCLVVTTVHDCQVIDDQKDMPEGWKLTQHDVPVDVIVTPTRIIRVPNRAPKPSGIFWDLLSAQKLAQIRVLQQLKKETEAKLGTTLPTGPDEILPPVASRENKTTNSKNKSNNSKNKRMNTEGDSRRRPNRSNPNGKRQPKPQTQ